MTSANPAEHRDQFIDGMSKAACTVNVVTTDGEAGRAGLTVSAMSSVSADPASLLICVNEQSRSCDIISRNGVFCVNVLSEGQSHISDTFSKPGSVDEKFAAADWNDIHTGSPALSDALVNFDCELKKSFKWGSHYILIGEVKRIASRESGNPLIYANRAYGRTAAFQKRTGGVSTPGQAKPLKIGGYHTINAFFIPRLVAAYTQEFGPSDITIAEGNQAQLTAMLSGGDIDLAVMYCDEAPDGLGAEFLFDARPHVLLPGGHPLEGEAEVSLGELADMPLISLTDPSGDQSTIDEILEAAEHRPTQVFTAPSFEVMRGMVGNGLGFAVTFTKPASNMTYDGAALCVRPIAGNLPSVRLALVHQPFAKLDQRRADFVRFCIEHFKEK